MFSVQDRGRVRARLLELAEADPAVVAAAITGSHAIGEEDRWSDIDLAFAVDGELAEVLGRWTELLCGEFGALHHWDLPFGSAIYRVFLLSGGLEVDLAFTPAAEFGPRGPAWRTVFGATVRPVPSAPPRRDDLSVWVASRSSCADLHRARQAVAGRALDQRPPRPGPGPGLPAPGPSHRLCEGRRPASPELRASLVPALVCSLEEAELRRALAAAAAALAAEVERTDAGLATRLRPILSEFSEVEP